MALNAAPDPAAPRNAGPGWGYGFLRRADRVLPNRLFDFLLGAGTWVAVATMPAERRHSRDYLTLMLGRRAGIHEVWRHFFTFVRMFMLRLRLAEGLAHECRALPGSEDFLALMATDRPTLFGTFHVGNSDLLGFFLQQFNRRVFMVRMRVGNSPDTEHLAKRFAPWVTFIWVNEPHSLLFALKEAVQSGGSIALKCDRPDHTAKLEAFDFLGARRLFPFTVYHLALMFRQPVVFCVSVPGPAGESLVHASTVFEPDGGSKAGNLARAHAHFQGFLARVEALLRANPYLWFNFKPLNPPAPAGPLAC
jgi:predicted LPLAT superfamily acyltransferase